MLKTVLLAGAAVVIGAPVALADGSNFQPYMFKHPAFGAESQAQPAAETSQSQSAAVNGAVNKPEASAEAGPEQHQMMRRHVANRMAQRRMARPEQVGQTWNSPAQSMYRPANGPYAWGYAPGPNYAAYGYGYGPGYAAGGYYAPGFASAQYGEATVEPRPSGEGAFVEGRAAYENPYGWWDPDYPEVGPPVGQTMSNPPSASMYFSETGPY